MENKKIDIIDLAICERFLKTLTPEQEKLFPDVVKALHKDSVFGCKKIIKDVFDWDRRDTYESKKWLEADLRVVSRKLNKYGKGDAVYTEGVKDDK
jgi:hypothetical protein